MIDNKQIEDAFEKHLYEVEDLGRIYGPGDAKRYYVTFKAGYKVGYKAAADDVFDQAMQDKIDEREALAESGADILCDMEDGK